MDDLYGKGLENMPPKICHFDIGILLSWRQLRSSRCKKSSLPSHLPKKTSICKGVPLFLSLPGRTEVNHLTTVDPDQPWDTAEESALQVALIFHQFPHVFTFPQVVVPRNSKSFLHLVTSIKIYYCSVEMQHKLRLHLGVTHFWEFLPVWTSLFLLLIYLSLV